MLDEFIVYGELKHAEEFQRLHPMCKEVCAVLSFIAFQTTNEKLTTTSIYRKKTCDSGIHEDYRAVDFRLMSHIQDSYRMIEVINSIYTYDPIRPELKVAAPNPFHGTGGHIHIQVHDNTTYMTRMKKVELITKASHDLHNFQAIPLGEGG